ncbi:MAG TPA: cytochrome d ubiquinol oxidase subunit II [Candidatus Saccharimonadales bacterium]|nr:cytochrome d ubiquinol oxidase subunit II [Candidatus Saccharimonadales bacterium]
MTLVEATAGVMWLGVVLYALFGGADFGAGFWDLVAGNAKKGAKQRALIEHSIGPVWEANHVWLIFVLVVMWTCFPSLFGAVTSTLWIPFTLAAFGIIARGSAFAFRKVVAQVWQQRLLGAAFAFSSIVTPFFFGTIAGAVAAGHVPSGVGTGSTITSWLSPMPIMTGVLAVTICAYLAAVYLTADARRSGDKVLVEQFRNRALTAAVVAGLVAVGGLVFLHQQAPFIADGLAHRGLPFILLSGISGLVALGLLYIRYFATARIFAAVAVAAVLIGWAAAQYPYVLPTQVTLTQAAAVTSVLKATLASMAVGALILIPSLSWLYVLFQKSER